MVLELILWMLSLVRCMLGGSVKIIVVMRLGIMLMLKNMIVGIRYMKVGMVCMKLSMGLSMVWMVVLCVD